ncbi:MAG: formimidoylglutamate deiminase [Nocardioidaceae bacterium]
MTTYWCEHAVLDGQVETGVVVEISAGVITSLSPDQPADGHPRLAGLTIPGLANCHSHAFHRALRGRTQCGRGSFWTWREQMYLLASRLDPDTYYGLARAVYREMAAAGITSVGEFHYLHHTPDGSSYDDANVLSRALVAAARDVGIRIALLDTCYLTSAIGIEVEGVQRRFGDGDVASWQARVEDMSAVVDSEPDAGVVLGAAIHSVRAVPRTALPLVAGWAQAGMRPLHVHVSEQVAENEACDRAYGCTPTELLADGDVLGPRTTAVHATHLTERDIVLLGRSRSSACFCPTTERDLGDGIGPARGLQSAGSTLTLGSDSHAVIDPFEEMRALEVDERLATQLRGHWSAAQLLEAGTSHGHASLGFDGAGRIAVGSPADLVTLDLRTPRTAGSGPVLETAVFAASASDVAHVVCDGRVVASRDDHEQIGGDLESAIEAAWGEA